jgi:hypothetical protein
MDYIKCEEEIPDDKDLLKILFKGKLMTGALNFRFFLVIAWYTRELFDCQELIYHNEFGVFAVLITP